MSNETEQEQTTERTGLEIAIIGMSARVPGAKDLDGFWHNLCDGVESLADLSDEEMREAGAPERVIGSPSWVAKTRTIDEWASFDAGFFGFSPREADILDPQHRAFIECAWSCLEDGGYDPTRIDVPVGVYAGSRFNGYLLNVYSNQDLVAQLGDFQVQIANDKDYLATRTSYKLNLGGPSVTVQSACSTALVAVHLGCQSLNAGECDMVIAGGSGLRVPDYGYPYTEGDVGSPDGRVRPFDEGARGTMFGSGLSAVLLKRLDDALEDGDDIRAIIRGSAVTNDGAAKVGFSAPGVDGQYRVLRAAQAAAEIDPRTISYVEAHGTGTTMGDPIEVTALTQAFRDSTDDIGFCALGSVKGNIGHLGVAAGGASLIKTVLALQHGEIPPSINFESPNPQIDFESSPFFVNTELREWPSNGTPRRAGVSAFGIGGTNAHIILEEAPPTAPPAPSRPWQLLTVAGRTPQAVDTLSERLGERLESHPELPLADVAHTLRTGRTAHPHRKAVVVSDRDDAVSALAGGAPGRTAVGFSADRHPEVAFLFSGQGSQSLGMARDLLREPVFRADLERSAEILEAHLDVPLLDLIDPPADREDELTELLSQTRTTQPALFAVEHALATLWRSWGVEPQALLGHSIGEYVAACLAGVFSREDALALVAERGRLMQELPAGSMMTVPLSEDEIAPRLDAGLSVAAVNAPGRSVVSGPTPEVEALGRELEAEGMACRHLHTSHAFHSPMMEPILQPFLERFEGVELRAPQIPFVSNVTGTWITDEEATDPAYWARHIRAAVRFAAGVGELLAEPERLLLEVGPGNSLTTLARRHPDRRQEQEVLASCRHPKGDDDDQAFLLKTLGQLWIAGTQVDWDGFRGDEERRRVSLPTYPFERQKFFIKPFEDSFRPAAAGPARKQEDLADWFHLPSWSPSLFPAPAADLDAEPRSWLVFHDGDTLSTRLVEHLRSRGQRVTTVEPGESFHDLGDADDAGDAGSAFRIAPGARDDYDALLRAVDSAGGLPDQVVHLWNLSDGASPTPPVDMETVGAATDRAFWSLLFLAQAFGKRGADDPVRWLVVSDRLQRVAGERELRPEKAPLLGPVQVIPLEYPNLDCRSVDLPDLADLVEGDLDDTVALLVAEATGSGDERVVAVRDGERWVQGYSSARLESLVDDELLIRDGGVVLITGGLGGIGYTFATHLAERHGARLALAGLSALPARELWDDWLETHGETDRTSDKIRKVLDLEAMGAEVIALSADVADPEQARALVEQTVERFGRLDGVIHSAGLAGGGMVQLKSVEAASAVLGPKVEGTLALEAALEATGVEPDFLLLCSSTIACVGGLGQVDYCAANSFLDSWAHAARVSSDRSRARRVVSVNWGAWEEVGMAVAAGIVGRHDDGAPGVYDGARVHALLDHCVHESADRTVYASELGPDRHWLLAEHRIGANPTLPGTSYLEIARAAFTHHASNYEQFDPGAPVEIGDVFFLGPLMVPEGTTREVRTFLERTEDGYKFRVASRDDDAGPGSDTWRPHVRGSVHAVPVPTGESAGPPRVDLDAIRASCTGETITFDGPVMLDEGLVVWGDHWQSLKSIELGDGGDRGLARLELPEEFVDEIRDMPLHPALVDVATGMIGFMEEDNFLPLSYGKVTVHAPLTPHLYSHVVKRNDGGARGETLVADVQLISDQGKLLVEIDHFAMRKVHAAAAGILKGAEQVEATATGETAAEVAPMTSVTPSDGPLGPVADSTAAAERPDAARGAATSEGILPAEGVEVLRRVLSRRLRAPQVIAAAKDLQRLIEQTASIDRDRLMSGGQAASVDATHDRPSLPTPFVAPRDEREESMATIWQSSLGIKEVGIHDNFFDLGGDSVMGIQLVARAKEVGFDLSPDQLFEHQTIAELMDLVGEATTARPAVEVWAEWLEGEGARLARESLDHWTAPERQGGVWPTGGGEVDGDGANRADSAREELIVTLDPEDSRRLVEDALPTLRADLEEAALAALADVARRHGALDRLAVRLGADARAAAPEGLEIADAPEPVPFTYPVSIDLTHLDGDSVTELVRRAKATRRTAPAEGATWAALARLDDPEVRQRLDAIPAPRLGLALASQGSDPDLPALPLELSVGHGDAPARAIELIWSFDPSVVSPDELEGLAGGVAEVLGRIARQDDAASLAVSALDFPEADLGDDDLAKVLSKLDG